MEWKTIENAPVAQPVLLWQRAWRHPFIGIVTDQDDGTCWLENPDGGKLDLKAFAEHWMPLPTPPAVLSRSGG